MRSGRPSDFEFVLFTDAGAVADQPSDLDFKVGVGSGVRWRSPVGPLEAAIAYGVDRRKFRLHLTAGFVF
jgi:translocation and assembly module TamA